MDTGRIKEFRTCPASESEHLSTVQASSRWAGTRYIVRRYYGTVQATGEATQQNNGKVPTRANTLMH